MQPDGRGAAQPGRAATSTAGSSRGCCERGIEPVATLYHWDLPQALQDGGGWAARDTAERFAEYAALMASALGDVVAQWITHNEPWVVAFLGHARGDQGARACATGRRPCASSHHLLLSHGLARRRRCAPRGAGAQVGITLNLAPDAPGDPLATRTAPRRCAWTAT